MWTAGLIDRLPQLGIVIGAATLCCAPSAQSQILRDPVLIAGGGISSYDLSGTGTTGVVCAAVALAFRPFLLIEPGMTFLRYDPQLAGGQHVSYLFPEVTVQVQVPRGPVRPYVGIGVGAATAIEGPPDDVLTLTGAIGARLWSRGQWGGRLEGRLRSVEPFHGVTADVTLAAMYRL